MSQSVSYPLGVAYAVTSALLFSTAGLLMRHIQLDAWEIVFWRCLFAAPVLGAVLIARHRGRVIAAVRATGLGGILSGCAMAYMMIAYCLALDATLVANVLACIAVTPFLTALLGWVVMRERVPLATCLGMTSALAGILMIVAHSLGAGGLFGNVLALSLAAMYAVYLVTMRRKRAIDMLPATLLAALLSALVALPLGLPFDITWTALPLLIAFGAGQLAGGLVFVTLASRELPAAPLSLIMLIEAVGGVLWAWLGVGEAPVGLALGGAMLVLLAALGNAIYGFWRRPSPAVAPQAP